MSVGNEWEGIGWYSAITADNTGEAAQTLVSTLTLDVLSSRIRYQAHTF